MTAAPESTWLSLNAVIAARFGGEMHVAIRPVATRLDHQSKWAPDGSYCDITGRTLHCTCDCGESFAVEMPSGEDWTIKQWLRSTADDPLSFEEEPHFTYIRTQLEAPPCAHWYRFDL